MTTTMRRGGLCAVIGLLTLTTGCGTAAKLPAYQKIADCLRKPGVQVTDPTVGQPWDDTVMNNLFSTDRATWDKALSACPDYKKVVIGVG